MATDQLHVQDWLRLIRAEFDELPDLKLTQPQVEELWGLDASVAGALLSALVATGFLRKTDKGSYGAVAPDRREQADGMRQQAQGAPARRSPTAPPRPKGTRAAGRQAEVNPTDEQIRARAYQLYLQRNGCPADPRGDWLQAERELTVGATERNPRSRVRRKAAEGPSLPRG